MSYTSHFLHKIFSLFRTKATRQGNDGKVGRREGGTEGRGMRERRESPLSRELRALEGRDVL